jgi:hypothetical protein
MTFPEDTNPGGFGPGPITNSGVSHVEPHGISHQAADPYDQEPLSADPIREAGALRREIRMLGTENSVLRINRDDLRKRSNRKAGIVALLACTSAVLATLHITQPNHQNTTIYAKPIGQVEPVPVVPSVPRETTYHLITYGPQVSSEEAENKLNRLTNCLGQDIGAKLYVEKLSKGYRPAYDFKDEDSNRAASRRDRHDSLLFKCKLVGQDRFDAYYPSVISFNVTK